MLLFLVVGFRLRRQDWDRRLRRVDRADRRGIQGMVVMDRAHQGLELERGWEVLGREDLRLRLGWMRDHRSSDRKAHLPV